MHKKIRFYISPFFLSRYYISKDIRYFIEKYGFRGTVLDLGCGEKPYKYLFKNSKYLGIDFPKYSINKDFKGEKPDHYFTDDYKETLVLPFPDEYFDNAVSFQVLEHHKRPDLMIGEMARVIRKGGLVLLTCPFIGGLHEEPNDFQRYTKYKLRELFEKNNCEIIGGKKEGSLPSVISMLINEHISSFAAKNKFCYFLASLIYLPFLLFQYLSLLLDKIIRSEKIFINYMILVRKTQ